MERIYEAGLEGLGIEGKCINIYIGWSRLDLIEKVTFEWSERLSQGSICKKSISRSSSQSKGPEA